MLHFTVPGLIPWSSRDSNWSSIQDVFFYLWIVIANITMLFIVNSWTVCLWSLSSGSVGVLVLTASDLRVQSRIIWKTKAGCIFPSFSLLPVWSAAVFKRKVESVSSGNEQHDTGSHLPISTHGWTFGLKQLTSARREPLLGSLLS